jgi:hypothetical protein
VISRLSGLLADIPDWVKRQHDELQAVRGRIRELEAALADAHMDYCLESAFWDIACCLFLTRLKRMKKRAVGSRKYLSTYFRT